MKVKIKKLHPKAVIPKYAKQGDAGLDFIAIDGGVPNDYGTITVRTGLAVEIPEGYVGLLFPRSSVYKSTGRLSNCVGVIDSGYRGEIMFNFDPSLAAYASSIHTMSDYKGETYMEGDKIGQMIILPYPEIEFEEVLELSSSERGKGGFGSTGK